MICVSFGEELDSSCEDFWSCWSESLEAGVTGLVPAAPSIVILSQAPDAFPVSPAGDSRCLLCPHHIHACWGMRFLDFSPADGSVPSQDSCVCLSGHQALCAITRPQVFPRSRLSAFSLVCCPGKLHCRHTYPKMNISVNSYEIKTDDTRLGTSYASFCAELWE